MLGRTIKPKVYLEGVEIDAYKVTVQAAIGTSSAAIVEVPPADAFFERLVEDPPGSGTFVQKNGVLPRSLLHVFFEDSSDPDGEMRLLFEGEVTGFQYQKTPDRRHLQIIAKDLTNTLSQAYVRYYSDFFVPYHNVMAAFAGIGTANQPDPERILLNLARATALHPEILSALQAESGRSGAGAAFRQIVEKAMSINSFFRLFDNRTKLSKKVVTFSDPRSRELLDISLIQALIQQSLSNLKEHMSVWDVFHALMELVFYFAVPVPSPPFLKNRIQETVPLADGGTASFTPSEGNTLASLLIKPYTWWTAPPNFNVIFPSQYKSFTFGRDFLSEPTRLLMSAFGIIETIAGRDLSQHYMFVAPQPLASKFRQEAFDSASEQVETTIRQAKRDIDDLTEQKRQADIALQDPQLPKDQKEAKLKESQRLDAQIQERIRQLEEKAGEANEQIRSQPDAAHDLSVEAMHRNLLTASDGVSLPSREDIKGVVFSFDYLTQSQVEVSRSGGVDIGTFRRYLSSVANFKLALAQHRGRKASLRLYFSPQVVAGLPALVVDPHRNFFGEVDVVTHVLDAQGMADTEIQLSFVREDDVRFAESFRNEVGETVFPRWVSEAYLPSNVGESVYSRLFPANRPDASKPGVQEAFSILLHGDGKSQVSAANRIRDLYFKAREKDLFALSFTRRNIATQDQTFQVLGAAKVGTRYVFHSPTDEQLQGATEYAAAARRVLLTAQADGRSE